MHIISNKYLKYFTGFYACTFYIHYSLLANTFALTTIPLIFFGTIFSYELLQEARVNKVLFSIAAISSVLVPMDIIVQYSVISLLTLLYPQFLRKNCFLKPISIAISWCLLFKSNSPTLYAEAFFFILALTLPFDLRDKKEDKTIKTLAHGLSTRMFKLLCLILWIVFISIKLYLHTENKIMISIAGLTIYYISNLIYLKENSSRFVTYILIDATILVQLALKYLI